MNTTIKLGLIALAAIAVLAVLAAQSALADPVDTDHPPTADWVFDSGKTTTILYKDWTVNYNISVTMGSTLRIRECDWTLNGMGGLKPIKISTDTMSFLVIELCTLDGTQGSGFYIEARNDLYINNSELIGLVNNPATTGGISAFNCFVQLSYVTLHRANTIYALYTYNCDVNISNSEFYDVDGTFAYFYILSKVPYQGFAVNIVESEFHHAAQAGLWICCFFNDGNATFNLYKVKLHDVGWYGIVLEDGQKTYAQGPDAGYGSLISTMDELDLYNVGDQGMFLCSDDKSSGPADLGFFNISILNSRIHNIKMTGMYDIRYYSISKHYLLCENTTFEDIALDTSYNRLSAIFTWRYGAVSGGYDKYYIGNCTFRRCNPGALWYWDHGQGLYGVGGIPRWFRIFQTEFTECTQAAIYKVQDEGGEPGYFIVENCSFHDNPGSAIFVDNAVRSSGYYGMTGPHGMFIINNTTFERHGKAVLVVTSNCVDQVQEIGFLMNNCVIDHSQGYAVSIRPTQPKGMMYLHMNNTRVNDTMGIFLFYDIEYATTAGFDVAVTNSTIENSTLTALYIRAQSSLTPEVKVIVTDTTIFNAGRDGISIYTGPTGTAQSISGTIVIERVTIMRVDGVGIKVTNDMKSASGIRSLYINRSTIRTAQQGVVVMGYPCDMWYDSVTDILLEVVQSSYNRVTTWFCDFTVIDGQKFNAASGGEIYMYYSLTIVVKWDTGAPAIGCTVEMTDNVDNLLTVQGISQPDGALPAMTMNSYIIRSTGLFSNSPYNIKVTCADVSKETAVRLDHDKSILIIMKDSIRPEVFINYPHDGHSQQARTIQVRGSAWDYQSGIDRVELSLDGVNWVLATGTLRWTYTFDVPMEQILETGGMFDLRATAFDHAGNSQTTYILVRIDPTPPKLLVNFPYDGYMTRDPWCTVRGVTEPGSSITVNGIHANVLVSMFTSEVKLVEGPNTLTVIAIDPMGNIEVNRVTVTLDTQKPYFQLVSPAEGAMSNITTIDIVAQLEADLEVTINDFPVAYGSEAYPLGAGTLSYQMALTSGDNIIHVTAKDRAGNVLSLDRLVLLDIMPAWIKVSAPRDGLTIDHPEITVTGTTEATSRFYVNDEDVTLQNGYFERTILGVEGINRITLKSIDPAGNVNTQVVTVIVDTRPPYLEITYPRTEVSTVNNPTIAVQGTVMQAGVVTTNSVTINGAVYTVTDILSGTFSVPVALLEGRNEITIAVQDAVGNAANRTMVVWLDTTAPTLVVQVDPSSWSNGVMSTPALLVNVSGYTEPGSVVYVNDVLVKVMADGTFQMFYPVNGKGETVLRVTSMDVAQNTRLIENSLSYVPVSVSEEKESGMGQMLLVIAIVLLVLVGIVAYALMRRSGREPPKEEGAGAALLVEVESPKAEATKAEAPRPPEAKATATPKQQAAAPVHRPVHPQPRRTVVPQRKAQAPAPGGANKPLSDKGADQDMVTDEIDQGVS